MGEVKCALRDIMFHLIDYDLDSLLFKLLLLVITNYYL